MSAHTQHTVDVLVIGRGIIGLSSAWHLAESGVTICVVGDPVAPGIATRAAAGMLTPVCEFDPWMPEAFLDLLVAGRDYYHAFLNGLAPNAVERCAYRPSEFLVLDLLERAYPYRQHWDALRRFAFDGAYLEPDEAARTEPAVARTAIRGAVLVRGEAVVDPRAVQDAIEERLATTSDDVVTVVDGRVTTATQKGAEWHVTTTSGATVRCSAVVVAAGAWSAEVGQRFGRFVPVCPVRGQIVGLGGTPGLTERVVYIPCGGCGSFLERRSGQYIAGTSEEYLSPSVANSVGVVGSILSRVGTVLPATRQFTIGDMWCGFRPMTPDEMPIIGFDRRSRVAIATGHHRNGVLLGPITGRLVADALLEKPAEHDITAFDVDRPFRKFSRFANKY